MNWNAHIVWFCSLTINLTLSLLFANFWNRQPSLSSEPSLHPSSSPTETSIPSSQPSVQPTQSSVPTIHGSNMPSKSVAPSTMPSLSPTLSSAPSFNPSGNPSTSVEPSSQPSNQPTQSSNPSWSPSNLPSETVEPSNNPTIRPSVSSAPSYTPSQMPSETTEPSHHPSGKPSVSSLPSLMPSQFPTTTTSPSYSPSPPPTQQPTTPPPTKQPTTTIGPYQFDDPCVENGSSPLAGATVLLYNTRGEYVATATTDENGVVVFHDLPGGRYSAKLANDPICPTSEPSIAPSISSLPTQSPVIPGPSAQVFDPCVGGNTPLVGATVRLVDIYQVTIQTVTTDQNGWYVFDTTPPGARFRIVVDYPQC